MIEQRLLDLTQLRVEWEDRILEVVADGRLPRGQRVGQEFLQRDLGPLGMHVAIGLFGADTKRRFDNNDVFALE